MNGQAPAFPPGRLPPGWWRQLAAWKPRRLLIAHLQVHQVEALVSRTRTAPLDRIDALVLRAMSHSPCATLESLAEQLHLDRPLLARLLEGLDALDLAACDPQRGWAPTAAGLEALASGTIRRGDPERRWFCFVERAGLPPHYLNLEARPVPVVPGPECRFDPGVVDATLRQSPEWKQRHGLPLELEAAASAPDWRRVMVDRPGRLAALLLANEEGGMVGFAFGSEWQLEADRPILQLGPGWHEVLPEAAADWPDSDWMDAWMRLCQQRGLVAPGTETRTVHPRGDRIEITVSQRLMEKLAAMHGDILRGETWLLAPRGSFARVASIDVRSESS